MAQHDGESGEANVHAVWRLALAERAARAYASNQKLAALTVAGSVGTGLADRFSDLELDCYWFDPPGDLDRSGPVHVLGGELEALTSAARAAVRAGNAGFRARRGCNAPNGAAGGW